MAFSEIELRRYNKIASAFIDKRRPPAHLRSELDLGYRISDQSLEIFEIRPLWNNPKERIENAVAKATFVKSQNLWKIYWQRQDLKWHRYDPDPQANLLEDFLDVVNKDEYCCFFG